MQPQLSGAPPMAGLNTYYAPSPVQQPPMGHHQQPMQPQYNGVLPCLCFNCYCCLHGTNQVPLKQVAAWLVARQAND